MGARELRSAFNEVGGDQAKCIKALLEYERANDTEWQVLYFSGRFHVCHPVRPHPAQ